MPFEAVLTDVEDRARVARLRQIVFSVLVLYISFLFSAFMLSRWRVEELSAPLRTVVIFQPPGAQTPQTFAGGARPAAATAKKNPRPLLKPKAVPAQVSQPVTGTSVAADFVEGIANSGETGSAQSGETGLGDGTGEGTGSGNASGLQGDGQPTGVSPKIAAQQCLHCPTPQVPSPLLQVASKLILAARICVDKQGAVTSIHIRQGVSANVDETVARTVRGWRFSPITVNGNAVPFCYPAVFVWKAA